MNALASTPPQADKPLILCIEDEADLREELAEELEEAGYLVMEAGDGRQALGCLNEMRPDLILCDITMPLMDGYELLDAVRQPGSILASIPFIFLTAREGVDQEIIGKRAGVDDYLVKPVDFDLMLATIDARLQQVARLQQHHNAEMQRVCATLLGRHEEQARQSLDGVVQSFNYLGAGVILLSTDKQIPFANIAARNIVGEPALTSFPGLLNSLPEQQAGKVSRAVNAAIAAYHAGQQYLEFLALPWQKGQHDLLMTVCALPGADNPVSDGMAVALFVAGRQSSLPVPIKALHDLFELTPTEARVAWAFAHGMRSEQIATAFGISLTTVAFHKRNLFQKTQTNRQADLVALLLTLPASVGADTGA